MDIDIDSNNDGSITNEDDPEDDPEFEETEDDPEQPGKLLWANQGDADTDGVPDFADGINIFEADQQYESVPTQDSAYSAGFTPVEVEIPASVDLDETTLTFSYSASDPGAVDREGYDMQDASYEYVYTPAGGDLRLWNRDGGGFRFKQEINQAAPVDPDPDTGRQEMGNFIASGVAYNARDLGFTDTGRRITLYVEAITWSESAGDRSIQVDADYGPDGTYSDRICNTALGLKLALVTGETTTEEVDEVQDSHPSPVVPLWYCQFSNVKRSPDGSKILADLEVKGDISSQLCDIIPGEAGTIRQAYVYLNNYEDPLMFVPGDNGGDAGEAPTRHVPVEAIKSGATGSLQRPYPYSGSFQAVFKEVPIEPHQNLIRVEVSDPGDPTKRLTGFIEKTIEVQSVDPQAGVPQIESFGDASLRLDLRAGFTDLAGIVAGTVGLDLTVTPAGGTAQTFALSKVCNSPLILAAGSPTSGVGASSAWMVVQAGGTSSSFSATVSVPALGIRDMVYSFVSSTEHVGRFVVNSPRLDVTLIAPFSDTEVNSILVTLVKGEQSIVGWTLWETDVDSKVFTNDDGTIPSAEIINISISDYQAETATEAGALTATVDYSKFGLSGTQFEMIADAGTLHFSHDDPVTVDADLDLTRNFAFNVSVGPTVDLAQSGGGEFHHFLTQFKGPEDVLETLLDNPGYGIMKGPEPGEEGEQKYYYYEPSGEPPSSSLALAAAAPPAPVKVPRPTVTMPAHDDVKWWQVFKASDLIPDLSTPQFLWGFIKGFSSGVVDIAGGLVDTAKSTVKNSGEIIRWLSKLRVGPRELAIIRKKAEAVKTFAEKILQIAQGQATVIHNAINGDDAAINQLSEEFRTILTFGTDMIKAVYDEIKDGVEGFDELQDWGEKGKVFGKFIFDVASWFFPPAKAGAIVKVQKIVGQASFLNGVESLLLGLGGPDEPDDLQAQAQAQAAVAAALPPNNAQRYAKVFRKFRRRVAKLIADLEKKGLHNEASRETHKVAQHLLTIREANPSLPPINALEQALAKNTAKDVAGKHLHPISSAVHEESVARALIDPNNIDPSQVPSYTKNKTVYTNRTGYQQDRPRGISTSSGTNAHLENHHGFFKECDRYFREVLGCAGTEHVNSTPAAMTPYVQHQGTNPKAIHSIANSKNVLKSIGTLILQKEKTGKKPRNLFSKGDVLVALRSTYNDAGMGDFGKVIVAWAERNYTCP